MELVESFPAQFCREIRSYWRRRKYQKLETSNRNKGSKRLVTKLGKRGWRLKTGVFRVRLFKFFSPLKLLKRLRDAYVDAMLSLAGRASGLSLPNAPAAVLVERRIPQSRAIKSKSISKKQELFERRLMYEIYCALAASGELSRTTAAV